MNNPLFAVSDSVREEIRSKNQAYLDNNTQIRNKSPIIEMWEGEGIPNQARLFKRQSDACSRKNSRR